jgi:hypothetical protein
MLLSEEVCHPLFKLHRTITKASEPAIAQASLNGFNFFLPI